MLLLKAYAPADSYATVIEQCNSARSPWPIGDFTFRGWTARRASSPSLPGVGRLPQILVSAPDLHIAFTDNVSKV